MGKYVLPVLTGFQMVLCCESKQSFAEEEGDCTIIVQRQNVFFFLSDHLRNYILSFRLKKATRNALAGKLLAGAWVNR